MKNFYSPKQLIKINVLPIFLFSIFWTFILNFGLSKNPIIALISLLVIGLSTYKILGYEKYFKIRIKLFDLLIVLISLLLFWSLNINFRFSVNGDQLYHILNTYQIPIGILKLLGTGYVNENLHISANLFFRTYSFLILITFIVSYYFFEKKRRLFLYLYILIGSCCLVSKYFFNPLITHPELRTLPLSLLGTVGINNSIFKLQGLLALTFLFLYLKKNLETKNFIIIFILLCSCPLLYFTAPIVEFSIWALAINSVLLIEIFKNGTKVNIKTIIILSTIICLGTLVRQSIAFSFIPLFIYLLLNKEYGLFKVSLIFSLISFCQIINSLFDGNPAIQNKTLYFLGVDINSLSILEKLKMSFDGMILKNKFLNLGIVYSALIVISLFLKGNKKRLFIVFFIVTHWLVFHQISLILWGNPRYIAEYLLPVAFLSLFFLVRDYQRYNKTIIFLTGIILLTNSITIISMLNSLQVTSAFKYEAAVINKRFESKILSRDILVSEEVYNWNEGIKHIPKKCYANSKMNINFGVFPLAFNKEVLIGEFISSHILTGDKENKLQRKAICRYKWAIGEEGLSYNKLWNTNLILIN